MPSVVQKMQICKSMCMDPTMFGLRLNEEILYIGAIQNEKKYFINFISNISFWKLITIK